MNRSDRPATDVSQLIDLFYSDPSHLGELQEVATNDLPLDERRLLAHENHMTVTVESFHGSPVDVQVIEESATPTHYARKILLSRQSDDQVVQFGLMRIELAQINENVREEILSRRTPLGRILIEHDVLRQVELHSLWRIEPGDELCKLLGLKKPQTVYGRTALIYCDGQPAVELLEIVRPPSTCP